MAVPELIMKNADSIDEQHRCAAYCAGRALERLNDTCFCVSLQDGAVKQALRAERVAPEVFALIEQRCPHLFSARPVFISAGQAQRMTSVVRAIDSVVALPTWRAAILGQASEIVRHDPGGPIGVFFGYDFHVHHDQIGLIEINTNAGGAMLNAVLARAQHASCPLMADIAFTDEHARALESRIVEMFRSEWRRARGERPLRTVAIVDMVPQEQFLYPEFLLFQTLFERHGWHTLIADPSALAWRDGSLWHGDTGIDLVYNRLTDFLLEAPACASLRAAYLAHAVVLTPHPQAHALYADKRNLVTLADPVKLAQLGVSADVRKILLDNVPHAEQVSCENAQRLWAERRHLFFKPNAGFGGRAAYRGDKLTKRVWQEILDGDYIAQAIVTPGERGAGSPEHPAKLKFDLRSYTYGDDVQWIAARTYQGQTTNFRTPGGGFAPVYHVADEHLGAAMHMQGAADAGADDACTV